MIEGYCWFICIVAVLERRNHEGIGPRMAAGVFRGHERSVEPRFELAPRGTSQQIAAEAGYLVNLLADVSRDLFRGCCSFQFPETGQASRAVKDAGAAADIDSP